MQTLTAVSSSVQLHILSLALSLLVELHQGFQVLECTPLPKYRRYAIHSKIFGKEVGPAVLIPRRWLERALLDPAARRTVRYMFHAAMGTLRRCRAFNGAPQDHPSQTSRSLMDPRCVDCRGPLLAEDPIVVEQANQRHLVCPPGW